MDVGKSFAFVVNDKDWVKKVAIGGVLLMVPIANLMVTGYVLRLLRRVADGEEEILPEWDSWGDDFVKGLQVVVASLIYALPALIVSFLVAAFGALAGRTSSDLEGVIAVFSLCINCLVMLWSLLVGLWMPGAMTNYAVERTFGSMFDLARIWKLISENPGNYLTALVVGFVASLFGMVGVIACLIGVVFTQFYAQLVYMHVLGQFAREAGLGTRSLSTATGELPALDDLPPDAPLMGV